MQVIEKSGKRGRGGFFADVRPVGEAEAAHIERNDELLQLADKYAGG